MITAPDGKPALLREKLLAELNRLADADSACAYGIASRNGIPEMTWLETAGGGAPEAAMRKLASHPEIRPAFSQRSFRRPRGIESHAFVEIDLLTSREELEQSAFFQRIWRPVGIADQIRLLVFDGDTLIALVAALRPRGGERFARRDRRRLQRLVEPTRQAILAADALDSLDRPEHRSFLIARPDGTIEHAAGAGRKWLDSTRVRVPLESSIRSIDRGESPLRFVGGMALDVIRLDGAPLRYLVCLTPALPLKLGAEGILSPRETQVSEYAAAGASVQEIASTIGSSPETVRAQLRAVYRKLGVASRVELAEALRRFRSNSRI